jgi:hypothetical protein
VVPCSIAVHPCTCWIALHELRQQRPASQICPPIYILFSCQRPFQSATISWRDRLSAKLVVTAPPRAPIPRLAIHVFGLSAVFSSWRLDHRTDCPIHEQVTDPGRTPSKVIVLHPRINQKREGTACIVSITRQSSKLPSVTPGSRSRLTPRRKFLASCSMPMKRRPALQQATPVENRPAVGSNTVSPRVENVWIMNSSRLTGFCVGIFCSPGANWRSIKLIGVSVSYSLSPYAFCILAVIRYILLLCRLIGALYGESFLPSVGGR